MKNRILENWLQKINGEPEPEFTHSEEDWTIEIAGLEAHFRNANLTTTPIRISPAETITNPVLFVNSHLSVVKYNNGKHTFLPYLERLSNLKNYIK